MTHLFLVIDHSYTCGILVVKVDLLEAFLLTSMLYIFFPLTYRYIKIVTIVFL